MDLLEYIDRMKELNTPVAMAAVILLCLFLVVIILKMLGGMRRGGWRQLLQSGLTLAAAIISYTVAVMVSNSIMGSTDRGSIEDFIAMMDGYIPGIGEFLTQALSTFNPEVFEYIIILPATIIIMPIMATAIFLLINFILKIVRSILIKIFGFKAAKSNSQRLYGALLGSVEAIIWLIMFTLPITGLLGIADRACTEALESEDISDDELSAVYEEIILPFTENPAYTFMDSLGSGALSDGIATIKIGGKETNLRNEILSVTQIGLVEIPSLDGADFAALTKENKESLDNIINSLTQSPFLANVVAGVVQSSSGFMNSELIPFEKQGEYGLLFRNILDFLEGVTHETLEADVNTIKEVYYAISDSQIIKALEENEGADVMSLLQEKRKEGDDTLVNIINILQDNVRTAPLVRAMTEALLTTLSNGVKLPDGSTVEISYESLKEDMNRVTSIDRNAYGSSEEYIEAISTSLDSTLADHGIEMEADIVDAIAEYISEEYSNIDELSDEQFNDMLLHYYDAYLEYVAG